MYYWIKWEVLDMPRFKKIYIEITNRCNLKCDYCHNSEFSNRDDDMTTEEILRLIESIKKLMLYIIIIIILIS